MYIHLFFVEGSFSHYVNSGLTRGTVGTFNIKSMFPMFLEINILLNSICNCVPASKGRWSLEVSLHLYPFV